MIAMPSVARIWSAGQLPAGMPKPVSAQSKRTVTLEVYQPFAPSVPDRFDALIVGTVMSSSTVTVSSDSPAVFLPPIA